MKTCHACGMPLSKKDDFANGDETSNFCHYCVNPDGSVKSIEEIFESGVQYFLSQLNGDRSMAEKIVRKNMLSLPYWNGNDAAVLKGEVATDDEFQTVLKNLS